jgi:type I restriction enzyme S subunit
MVDEAGHGTGRLATDRIKSLRIALPPASEQRAIAQVLGVLDDKLEANYWLARLNYDLAVAVGVQSIENAVGPWQSIEDVATISKGVSYKSEDLVEGLGWLVSLKCAGRDGSFHPDGLKPFSGDVKPAHIVDDGDILVSQTDLTQRAEVIGRPFRVVRSGVLGRLVGSLDFSIVRPKPPLSREALLALLSTADFRSHVLGYCNGTTVLHMNSRAIPSFQFRMPEEQEITRVSEVMNSLLKESDSIQGESRALEKLRETLLPKLVSGELRVHDAELLVKHSA